MGFRLILSATTEKNNRGAAPISTNSLFVYKGVRTYPYLPTSFLRDQKSTPYDVNKQLAETVARSRCFFFQQQLKQLKELATLVRVLILPMPWLIHQGHAPKS